VIEGLLAMVFGRHAAGRSWLLPLSASPTAKDPFSGVLHPSMASPVEQDKPSDDDRDNHVADGN
jgi:hypothetical protein